jgi:hypothetical protein
VLPSAPATTTSGDAASPQPAPTSQDAGPAAVEPEPAASCPVELDAGKPTSDAGDQAWKELLAFPWQTSFEDGFCAYADVQGFCYADPDASYDIVTSPVHSGSFAAAFTTTSDAALAGVQARCVRRGTLPQSAYYGAWYYIPARATNTGNWNLFHFQGEGDGQDPHSLWDVSLGTGPGDDLHLYMLDFLNGGVRERPQPLAVPIGAWFHIELLLRRAADASGEIALYQDGEELFRATDIITDDAKWGLWYVGNWTDRLSPVQFTVYVDDVTIREAP